MKPLAITLGDAAGIGPEIIVQAFRDAPQALQACFVVGDAAVLRRAAQWVRREGEMALPLALIDHPRDVMI